MNCEISLVIQLPWLGLIPIPLAFESSQSASAKPMVSFKSALRPMGVAYGTPVFHSHIRNNFMLMTLQGSTVTLV